MRPRSRCLRPAAAHAPLGASLLLLVLGLVSGCEEPRHVNTNINAPAAPAPAPAPEPAESKEILGKRTQEIHNADVELKQGAQVATTKITAKDPITLPGNAYVTIVGRNSILNIQHAVDLYHATNGEYPKDYNEFMEKIIKENNIALPKLPDYQDYGYDPKEHKLIILEYPDRKAAPAK